MPIVTIGDINTLLKVHISDIYKILGLKVVVVGNGMKKIAARV